MNKQWSANNDTIWLGGRLANTECVQYSTQDADDFDDAINKLSVQYVFTLETYGAHEF